MKPTDRNPDLLEGAPPPTVHSVRVDDASLHVEVRGSGPAVLLVGAADEDAEVYRGIAERLATACTVVSYDRRGTGRSDSASWPSDTARHAGDAIALIDFLTLDDVTVLGASAGGLVTLRMALSHPDLLRTVLCYEPGVFEVTDAGRALRLRVEAVVSEHLRTHEGDWSGAVDELGRAAVGFVENGTSLFAPPEGGAWFARRTATHAESLIRGDIPLTLEIFDPQEILSCPVNLRFAHGTASLTVFEEVVTTLAGFRGESPDTLDGLGHSIFYHPDAAARYVRNWI
ncbi:MAG: alpha/beta hydrolase [Acidimicrobiia bacterium]